MSAVDSWNERVINIEFLFSKNGHYKTVDLNFYERQYAKKQPLIDILQIDCSKIKLDDELKIYYDSFPWDISIKKIAAAKIKGNRLKKKTYLQIMRIGLSDLICNNYRFNQ